MFEEKKTAMIVCYSIILYIGLIGNIIVMKVIGNVVYSKIFWLVFFLKTVEIPIM